MAALFATGMRRALTPGAVLFRRDDAADHLFLIQQGRLHMLRHLASGHAIIIHAGRAGELFAEGALFADTYQCDAQAAEQSVVASCPKHEARRALVGSPSLAMAWIERVTRQLHAARTLLELRNIRSAEDRVMQHLRLRADPAGEIAVEGRLLDGAAELGLSCEAYYRSLAALERAGLISRGRRTIRLSLPSRILPTPGSLEQ